MGSTVVLVFEAPPLDFSVKPGDKVKMGESIAIFKNQATNENKESLQIEEIPDTTILSEITSTK